MSLPLYAIPGDPTIAPFLIEVGLTDARVTLGKNLARSGLLAHLPVELLPVLLALLSQVRVSGNVHADTVTVARLLGLHPDDAEVRLHRLAAFPSAEQPLVYISSGAWGVSKQYCPPVPQTLSVTAPEQEAYRPTSREEVILHSRQQYATPVQEAERQVEAQLGIEPLPEGEAGEVLQALRNLGVRPDTARELLAAYPLARIQAQLHWLPKRAARNPARYLISAIQKDFGPPGPPQDQATMPPIPDKPGDHA
jgi:hypothetical protein